MRLLNTQRNPWKCLNFYLIPATIHATIHATFRAKDTAEIESTFGQCVCWTHREIPWCAVWGTYSVVFSSQPVFRASIHAIIRANTHARLAMQTTPAKRDFVPYVTEIRAKYRTALMSKKGIFMVFSCYFLGWKDNLGINLSILTKNHQKNGQKSALQADFLS